MSGELVPVWAAKAWGGLGSPAFEFHPLLQHYLGEVFYVALGNVETARWAAFATLLAAGALGMFLLAGLLLRGLLELPLSRRALAQSVAASVYVLCPVFFGQHAATLAIAPWVLLLLGRIAIKPSFRRMAAASVATCALLLTGAAQGAALVAPASLVALVAFRGLRARLLLLGALLLGAAASSFHWAPQLLEQSFIRILPQDTSLSLRMHELALATGTPAIAAILWFMWRWAGAAQRALAWKRGSRSFWAACASLALFSALPLYALHHSSVRVRELVGNPELTLHSTLFGVLLLSLALAKELQKPFQLAIAAGVSIAVSAAVLLTSQAVMPAPAQQALPLPAEVAARPDLDRLAPLRFLSGRGEGSCTRSSPTRLTCDVFVVKAANIEFRLFDYPNWKAQIDGKPAAKSGTDATSGMLWLKANPGKHQIEWRLGITPVRLWSRVASLLAWVLVVVLAISAQYKLAERNALAPKSLKGLEA